MTVLDEQVLWMTLGGEFCRNSLRCQIKGVVPVKSGRG